LERFVQRVLGIVYHLYISKGLPFKDEELPWLSSSLPLGLKLHSGSNG